MERKKYPIIKELLKLYENMHFLDEKGSPNLATCVKLQNPFYKKLGFINNGDYQIVKGMTVYPEAVFSPKDLYTGEIIITKNTFSIHHYDGSWINQSMLYSREKLKELYEKIV